MTADFFSISITDLENLLTPFLVIPINDNLFQLSSFCNATFFFAKVVVSDNSCLILLFQISG